MVGRERELGVITQARDAGSAAVVVSSSMGLGKSRLAREVLAQAERDGASTVWVQATRSASNVPMGAFAGVISADLCSGDAFEALRRGGQTFRELGRARPLVIGVDDAHLLDAASAALVLQLVGDAAAFVVATVCEDEPCPDAIGTLWKDHLAPRLTLAPLGRAETVRQAELIVGGPLETVAGHWIWDTSRGNPLYVRELLLAALDQGALAEVNGIWRLRKRPLLEGLFADLLSSRLMCVSRAEEHALALLAFGEPLRVSELVDLTGAEPLTALERRGLVSVDCSHPRGEAKLAHPLYREAVRGSVGTLRANQIRLRLADTLRARPDHTPELAVRVVRWMLQAGEPVPPSMLLDAAHGANLSGEPELARRLCLEAIDAGLGTEARLLLARAYAIDNRFEEAATTLAALEGSLETDDAALRYLEQQFAVLGWGLKRVDELRALLMRAGRWWPDERWRRRVDQLRARAAWLTVLGDHAGPAEECSAAGDDDLVDPEVGREAHLGELTRLYHRGRGREAHELARRLSPALPLRCATEEAVVALTLHVALESGHGLRELEEWAMPLLDEAVEVRDDAAAGAAALALGAQRLLEGRFVDAGRWLLEAQFYHERRDPAGLAALTASLQTWLASATRDRVAADAALARCREATEPVEPLPGHLYYRARAESSAAVANGDPHAARVLLRDAAVSLEGFPLYATALLYEAMRAGSPASEIAPAMAAVGECVDAPLLRAMTAHAQYLASRHAPGLLETVDELEEVGASLYASEAAAHAAEIFLVAGRQDSARRAAARSRELLAPGQGAAQRRIEGLDGAWVGLTPREQQLAELAKVGHSNREIAARIGLSVRTVESHMYRAMQKLGISDRRELFASPA